MIEREKIYSTLFALVKGSSSYTTADRRLRHWSDVEPAEMPFLCMSEKGGHAAYKALGTPTEWTLSADFYIYVHSSDPYLAPAIILNPLIDAVERALAPDSFTGLQRLGLPDMVQHARIQGGVQTDEGVLGDQAIAVIPIEILCI